MIIEKSYRKAIFFFFLGLAHPIFIQSIEYSELLKGAELKEVVYRYCDQVPDRIEKVFQKSSTRFETIETLEGTIVQCIQKDFDSKQRILKETFYGNISGLDEIECFCKEYEYSGEDLLTEKFSSGEKTSYSYDQTGRVQTKLQIYQNHFVKNTFFYAENGFLKKEKIEEGILFEDLTKIKKHHLILYEPDPIFSSLPCQKKIFSGEEDSVIIETHRFRYCEQGQLTLEIVTDAKGMINKTVAYDEKKRVMKEIDRLGHEIRYTYDALDRIKKITFPPVLDPNEQEVFPAIEYRYDLLDRPITVIDPKGYIYEMQYNILGSLLEIHYPDGTHEKYIHDSENHTYECIDRKGITSHIDLWQSAHPLFPSFWGNYWELDNFSSACHPIEHQVYNELHQSVLQKIYTDENGIRIIFTFDAMGRIAIRERRNAAGFLISKEIFRYDLNGNLAKITQERPSEIKVFRMSYGPMNRLEEMMFDTEEGLKVLSIQYGPNGQILDIFRPDYPTEKMPENILELIQYNGKNLYLFLKSMILEAANTIQKQFFFLDHLKETKEQLANAVTGNLFLILSGFYEEKTQYGVYGNGEVNTKVRLTYTNGILNTHDYCIGGAKMLSEANGGVNVHYVFGASEGWTADLVRGLWIKCGYISPQARQLAETWKKLIREMGGVKSGGLIIHYAHSLGGADTYQAKHLMDSEELKMIRVYTFGSPLMVPDRDFESVKNFASYRDGVCLIGDPLKLVQSQLGYAKHIKLVGTIWGIPIINHLFSTEDYRAEWEELGKDFINKYF